EAVALAVSQLVVHHISDKLLGRLDRCGILALCCYQTESEQGNYQRCAKVHDAGRLHGILDDRVLEHLRKASHGFVEEIASGKLNAAKIVQSFTIPVHPVF
ncbi:MAG: hypothetical protein JO300_11030, partial [Silvibacterium sp.]|nr:hypothetical protein [Silvibacterium sp.]